MKYHAKNKEILAHFDELVYGHITAKKGLINLINRSIIRHHQKYAELLHSEYLIHPHKLLLIGGSGTGKTHLVESLRHIVDFPLLRIDATKLNPTGAAGGVKESQLQKKIVECAQESMARRPYQYSSLEGTIDKVVVFVDEVDKLGNVFGTSGQWNQHVQANFLTLFENKEEFAGVSWIFAGAFSDLTNPEKVKNTIGFGAVTETKARSEITDEDIIKYGLIPEFVGRINNIVELDRFTEVQYHQILEEKLLPQKRLELSYFGIYEDGLTDEDKESFVKEAATSGQGVRSLARSLNQHFINKEFDYEDDEMFLLMNGE